MPPRYISVSLTPLTRQQLEEIAQEAKMTPGRVAGLLLEEIIPNIRAIPDYTLSRRILND